MGCASSAPEQAPRRGGRAHVNATPATSAAAVAIGPRATPPGDVPPEPAAPAPIAKRPATNPLRGGGVGRDLDVPVSPPPAQDAPSREALGRTFASGDDFVFATNDVPYRRRVRRPASQAAHSPRPSVTFSGGLDLSSLEMQQHQYRHRATPSSPLQRRRRRSGQGTFNNANDQEPHPSFAASPSAFETVSSWLSEVDSGTSGSFLELPVASPMSPHARAEDETDDAAE